MGGTVLATVGLAVAGGHFSDLGAKPIRDHPRPISKLYRFLHTVSTQPKTGALLPCEQREVRLCGLQKRTEPKFLSELVVTLFYFENEVKESHRTEWEKSRASLFHPQKWILGEPKTGSALVAFWILEPPVESGNVTAFLVAFDIAEPSMPKIFTTHVQMA